jgi:hypothetical protein
MTVLQVKLPVGRALGQFGFALELDPMLLAIGVMVGGHFLKAF